MLDQMTNGQLQWEPLENPFDHVVLGPPENRRRYPIYSGRTRFPEELKKCFPGEEKAIDEYLKLAKVGYKNLAFKKTSLSLIFSSDLYYIYSNVKMPFLPLNCVLKKLHFSTLQLHYPDFC